MTILLQPAKPQVVTTQAKFLTTILAVVLPPELPLQTTTITQLPELLLLRTTTITVL